MTMHSEEALVSDTLHDLDGELRDLMNVEVGDLPHLAVPMSLVHALIPIVCHGLLLLVGFFLLFFLVIVLAGGLPGKTCGQLCFLGFTLLLLCGFLLLDLDL
jgi:hypothetical protein